MATIEVKGVNTQTAKQLHKSIKMILASSAGDSIKCKALEVIQAGLRGGNLEINNSTICKEWTASEKYSKPI